jgi:hypothetical protein
VVPKAFRLQALLEEGTAVYIIKKILKKLISDFILFLFLFSFILP